VATPLEIIISFYFFKTSLATDEKIKKQTARGFALKNSVSFRPKDEQQKRQQKQQD
jgi:hypothetical protein